MTDSESPRAGTVVSGLTLEVTATGPSARLAVWRRRVLVSFR